MNTSIKKYLVTGLVIVLLITALVVVKLKQLNNATVTPAGAGFPVTTAIARKGTLAQELSYVGTVEPSYQVDLAAKISARILSINGQEGDRVKSGGTAVALDNGDLQSKLNTLSQKARTSKVNLDYWKTQLERNQALFQEGAISEQDFQKIVLSRDTALSGYAEAQAALQEARIGLDSSLITYPMSGTILAVHSYPGDMTLPGKSILTIADLSQLRVTVKVMEEDLLELREGTTVYLSLQGQPQRFPAKVTDILPTLDKTLRTGTVLVALPGDFLRDHNVKPGMSIPIGFILKEKTNTLVVPRQTVKSEGNSSFVYLAKAGKAVRRVVTTGISNADLMEITGGLTPGEQIIASGLNEIYDGRTLFLAEDRR